MKKILIIGGTRFIGKYLVCDLLKKNHDVTIATRGIAKDTFGNSIKRIIFDRYNEQSIIDNLKNLDFDIVYDSLAYSSWDVEILLPNITCKKYIVTSSTAVYNEVNDDIKEEQFKTENYKYKSLKRFETNYAEGKRLVEVAVTQKYSNIKSICVRFPFIIGIDDYTVE